MEDIYLSSPRKEEVDVGRKTPTSWNQIYLSSPKTK